MRIRRAYSGIKQKATGFVYLKGSPSKDTEGSSHIISWIHDTIINYAQILGGNWQKIILIGSAPLEQWRSETWDNWNNWMWNFM